MLVILFLCFIVWCGVEYSPENRAQREKGKIWVKEYGHTEEELAAIIRKSPNVDKVVDIIAKASYPQTVCIQMSRIVLYDGKNPYGKEINYKEFNWSDLHSARLQGAFAEALKEKLPSFYELHYRDEEFRLEIKKEEKKENCTFKGW